MHPAHPWLPKTGSGGFAAPTGSSETYFPFFPKIFFPIFEKSGRGPQEPPEYEIFRTISECRVVCRVKSLWAWLTPFRRNRRLVWTHILAFFRKTGPFKFVNSVSKNTSGTADDLQQTASEKNFRFLREKYFKIWPFSPYGQNIIREKYKKKKSRTP